MKPTAIITKKVAQAAAARITAVEETMKNTAAESAEALKVAQSLDKQIADACAATMKVNTRLNEMADELERMYARVKSLSEKQEECTKSVSQLSTDVKKDRSKRVASVAANAKSSRPQQKVQNQDDPQQTLYQRVMEHKWEREGKIRAESMLETLSEVSSSLPPTSVPPRYVDPPPRRGR